MAVGAPQQILSGKYRLERELGRGGMGSVWLAQHLTLRSPVAIKLIDAEVATKPEALPRFLREAQAAAALRSPHVVQILDHGVDDGVPFIVMELLEGESLAARIERLHWLSAQDTAHILTQVGRAMTKAHEAGIVHRDLKPDNIFIVRNDEEEIAKVLDFGVAKSHAHGLGAVSSTTRTGSVLGTPYYMSPEQAEGAKSVDQRSDIWAMGVIAWECLLGTRPFEAETLGGLLLAICAREMPVPSSAGPVPAGFDAWFARACSRDLQQRFATAKEAAQELRHVCSGQTLVGGSATAPVSAQVSVSASSLATTTAQLSLSTSSPTPKRARAPWIALGVLSLAAVGAGFLALGGAKQSDAAASAAAPVESPSPAAAALPTARAEPQELARPASESVAAPAVVAPASAAVVARAAPPASVAPHAAPRPIKHAAIDKPQSASVVRAPAAPAQPAAKPRVNLGI